MKKYFFILFAVAALASCSKDKNNAEDPQPAPIGDRIKTITTNGTINYSYDALGRLTLISISDGSKVEYIYTSGLLTKKYYLANGNYSHSLMNELSLQGKVLRSTLTNNPTYELQYVYNANGTKAKLISKNNGNTNLQDYFYSNGNLDSIRLSSLSNGWYATMVKTYYTDKANVLGHEATGETYFGTSTKNLVKSDTYIAADGSFTGHADYVYEFDGQGRVSKLTTSQLGTVEVQLYSYY